MTLPLTWRQKRVLGAEQRQAQRVVRDQLRGSRVTHASLAEELGISQSKLENYLAGIVIWPGDDFAGTVHRALSALRGAA